MGNLQRAVAPVATALKLLFGGLTITQKPQYQRRKIELCVATTGQNIFQD